MGPFFRQAACLRHSARIRTRSNKTDRKKLIFESLEARALLASDLLAAADPGQDLVNDVQTAPLQASVATPIILDNSDAGFTRIVGPWPTYSGLGGYDDGAIAYSGATPSANRASWTFTGLELGAYRVSATWPAHSSGAVDTPFTVSGGSAPLTTQLDQRLVPNDVLDAGKGWEDIATFYSIVGSTLTVEISGNATGWVRADAIRIERVGDAEDSIVVSLAPNSVSEAAGVSASVGTVTRTGSTSGDLIVSLASADPSVASVPASVTILDGQSSATFDVDVTDDSIYTGDRDVAITATGGSLLAGVSTITVADNELAPIYMDNSDPGFKKLTGAWPKYSGLGGFDDGTIAYSGSTPNENRASWTFTGLPAGAYRVSATWPAHASGAVDTPFTVSGGSAPLTTRLDQRLVPDDLTDAGAGWEDIATFYSIVGSKLTVEIGGDATGWVRADAIRIQRIGDAEDATYVSFSPATVSEAAGAAASTGTVTRTGSTSGDLIVALASADPSVASVPASVTILDGQASATFAIDVFDDSEYTGTRAVAISATTGSLLPGEKSLQIADDDSAPIYKDNSDAGFTRVSGAWPTFSGLGGFDEGAYAYAGPTASSDTVRWKFTGLPVGAYEVSATWPAHESGAIDAPFTVSGGSAPVTTRLDQRLAPDDLFDAGVGWETISANYSLLGSTLTVELSGDTTGWLRADAIRIRRIGDADDSTYLTFSPATVSESAGASASVGTVTRTGSTSGDLIVSLASADPSVASVPASVTILDGQSSATFDVDVTDDGQYTGTRAVSITASGGGLLAGLNTITVTDDDPPPRFLDNSDAAFTRIVGSWPAYSGLGGFDDGAIVYAPPSATNHRASWTFTGLTAGAYRVSATWPAHSSGATNTPFTLRGGLVTTTNRLNQELVPDDLFDEGAWWEDISASYSIYGSTLTVEIGSDADEWVRADAVRIVRIGDPAGALTVSLNDAAIGEEVGPAATTGTVTRLGSTSGDLVVTLASSDTSEATVPATVTILDGQSTATFDVDAQDDGDIDGTQTVTISASAAGFDTGQDSLDVIDNEAAPVVAILDNSQAGFSSVSGPWATYSGLGGFLDGAIAYAGPSESGDRAQWVFTGLPPGDYRVSATWPAHSSGASDTPFTILGGAGPLTNRLNQELAPNDFTDAGAGWEDIVSSYRITGSTLTVQISDDADEWVRADAIRIEELTPLPETLTVVVAADSISEADGPAATTATVTRSGSLAGDLIVTLTSGDTSEAAVPTTVTILDGQASATFDIDAIDDVFFDDTRTVSIIAEATGYATGYDSVDVTNDEVSSFEIEVVFIDSSLTPSQQAVFTDAAQRWAEIIVGDIPDVFVSGYGLVDDVVIEASAPSIDGRGGILGQAGPTRLRNGSFLPSYGIMQFDSADLASLESSGQLVDVILHEMGHVIGIGTIWDNLGLLTGAGGSNPRFTGANATAQFNAIFGGSSTSVPVANTGGGGTRDSHWRESTFNNELMTGYIDSGSNPISGVTIGQLEDLGYQVNYASADPYTPPGGLAAGTSTSLSTGSTSALVESEDHEADDHAHAMTPLEVLVLPEEAYWTIDYDLPAVGNLVVQNLIDEQHAARVTAADGVAETFGQRFDWFAPANGRLTQPVDQRSPDMESATSRSPDRQVLVDRLYTRVSQAEADDLGAHAAARLRALANKVEAPSQEQGAEIDALDALFAEIGGQLDGQ
ncbi:MAG: hypothetical protein KDA42_01995 [Planctomycetales bacterium]|nr:hypothetical protein [Planctomycetales bacterium]